MAALVEMKSDDIALITELSKRLLDTHELYLRARGVECKIPTSMENDFRRLNALKHRIWQLNDYRMSEAEKKSVREIAQWIVDIKCDLCGQDKKVLKWRD